MLDSIDIQKITDRSRSYYESLTGKTLEDDFYKIHLYLTDDDQIVMENDDFSASFPSFIFYISEEEFQAELKKVERVRENYLMVAYNIFQESITFKEEHTNKITLVDIDEKNNLLDIKEY